MLKMAIHNLEKNEVKFFAKIPWWQQISTKKGVGDKNSPLRTTLSVFGVG